MTGRELLMMTHQTSPAEVELTCYYTVKNTGGQHLSPDSHISSVTVHNVEKIDSTTSQRVSTFSVTAGQTFSTTARKTDSLSSISPGSVKPTVGGTTDSTDKMTPGFLVTSPVPQTNSTDKMTPGFLVTSPVPQTNAENFSQTIPAFPATTVMMIWRFIAVGITSLFLLRLTLYFCKSRTVEQVWMSSLNNREMAGCDEPTLLQH
ncbi:uncharacterized protein LOC124857244 [Girardinichthys multiradiatus]|uniref:uncharacterized protein LOC124857244 n=1 Tax=Girardinichthys multiradiatus TaxID=208333 RepID=UPI001FABFF0B|nr:uncharacterized protein LOC124857244 [Girardinichthys multiradiatus]